MKKFNLKNKKYGYLILAIIVLIIAIIVVSVLKKDKSPSGKPNSSKTTEAVNRKNLQTIMVLRKQLKQKKLK